MLHSELSEGSSIRNPTILKKTLNLMGDWCSEEIIDTLTQRNYGNGKEALNLCVGHPTFDFGKKKNGGFLALVKYFLLTAAF